MNPFFSVIIPTYNRGHLITKPIESVIGQTFTDWELIIVDDGSTDNTREVVNSYQDTRIKYIFQQNAERSAARNNGIKNARGTYICFLDSDDYYLPHRLEFLYKELKNLNFPTAFFYTALLLEENRLVKERSEQPIEKNIFDHVATSVIHSQQACIHQTILHEFNYDTKFHIGEDMELWLRIAEKFPFNYLENQSTVVVVDHHDRSINIKRFNSNADRLRMLKEIFLSNRFGKKISNSVKKQLLSSCYFSIAKYFIYNKQKANAIKNLALSITTDLSHYQNKYRLNLLLNLFLPNGNERALRLLE